MPLPQHEIPVFGEPDAGAVEQINRCMEHESAVAGALMADHHLGYSMPIGGVIAYRGHVSPSGVGYDIACGNKAVRLNMTAMDLCRDLKKVMDRVYSEISFGIGRVNNTPVDHDLFDDPTWKLIERLSKSSQKLKGLRTLAMQQLGTVGSGNHYVDLFADQRDRVWCGVHFGSRGLGHRIATHFIKAGGGTDGINSEAVVFKDNSRLGRDYLDCMELAGRYAYAGRDWVCQKVANILGVKILEEVHNHHNFAWHEEHFGESVWVVRKGATPAWPGQKSFVGGSMGDTSVILEGTHSTESDATICSTVHGAGRVMSRTRAAGKRRWNKQTKQFEQKSEGEISRAMMMEWVNAQGVELRGAGTDESPHCYKRLPEVLSAQGRSVKVRHYLAPIGVAMAGANEHDPYKD